MKRYLVLTFLILFAIAAMAQQKDLDYFLQMASQNSPLLKEYEDQAKANELDSLLIRQNNGVHLDAFSAGSYAPVVNGWGYDAAITNIADVGALLSASKQITGKRNLQNKLQSLQYQKQSVNISRKLTEQELHKTITDQYITAFGNYQLYQSNKQMLETLKQQDVMVRKLTEEGVLRQTEYLSLLVNLHKQELLVSQLSAQYRNDFGMLNYLCGIRDTAFIPLPAPDIAPDSTFEPQSTYFFQQFTVDSLKLATDKASIDFDYQPKISLYADAGYHSSFAVDPYKNLGASAGFTIAVPVYDGHQRKTRQEKVTIREKTRVQYKDFFLDQYEQKIAMLEQQLRSAKELVKQAKEQVKFAKTLVEADNKLMNSGDISVTEYILAINNYLEAKNTLIQQSVSEYQIINEINYWSRAR